MKLSKIHVYLHQVGINTKAYKTYVKALQKELDDNKIIKITVKKHVTV